MRTAVSGIRICPKPQPGDLQEFRAKVPTVRGAVEVKYQRLADGYQVDTSLPGNTTVWVGLPEFDKVDDAVFEHNGESVRPSSDGPKVSPATTAWFGPLRGGKHSFVRHRFTTPSNP